jgi:uncharacterized membrane protein
MLFHLPLGGMIGNHTMTFFGVLGAAFLAAWLLPKQFGGRVLQPAARRAMGVAFVVAGVTHFLMPASFLAYFPPWVPFPKVLNNGSGLVEVVGGLALLVPHDRIQQRTGKLLALYLVLIFPANVYVAVAQVKVPGLPDVWWYPWARLPFQALFIWWALRSTIPEHARTGRRLVPQRMRLGVAQ